MMDTMLDQGIILQLSRVKEGNESSFAMSCNNKQIVMFRIQLKIAFMQSSVSVLQQQKNFSLRWPIYL